MVNGPTLCHDTNLVAETNQDFCSTVDREIKYADCGDHIALTAIQPLNLFIATTVKKAVNWETLAWSSSVSKLGQRMLEYFRKGVHELHSQFDSRCIVIDR